MNRTPATPRRTTSKSTTKKRPLKCGAGQIAQVVREIEQAGLKLRSSASDTQLTTLPKVLAYLGSRGLNTYQGTALGYLRIATRIKDLEDEYEIASLREDVVGPDGLVHKGVARYVLMGKRKKDQAPAQASLPLEPTDD